ncbi:hypothetical protein ACS0TY_003203 [Phlomoides rotata]
MAVYLVVATLHRRISKIIKRVDVLLPFPSLKILEFAEKELKSFQNFVERLDSKSRERMRASLQGIIYAIVAYIEENSFIINDLNIIVDGERYEDVSRGIHSLVEQLKKVEKEYYTFQEDDQKESKMVGLCDQRSLLKDGLILLRRCNNIFYSIFGMIGIVKTTLARKIFEDLDIIKWFECRVWVTAGRERTSEDITEDILAQLHPEYLKMVMGGSEEEKREGLKESLKGKKYLIVLDDVWNQSVRNYLKSSFPDDRNGSHVFAGVSCPPHLEDTEMKIAEKCDGLPLIIVTIADLLSKVLNPSYEILFDNIKNNFLYMGAFPLKYEIPKSRLINLWIVLGYFHIPHRMGVIAEEFVEQESGEKTLENLAVDKLSILASCSLIMVYQKNIYGFLNSNDLYIKTCGLHSTWWHFCQTKARETNLFHVLDCYNENDIEEAIEGQTMLSIHNNVLLALKHVYNSIEEICAFTARSLLCFGPYSQYMVPIYFGLKFLRRLDALNIHFYDFPLEVLKLVKLRYLALTCNGTLPPSIFDLRKLQYLIVHPHLSIKSCGVLFNLPMEIWDMKRLKHLQVTGYDLPNLSDTSLQELITLLDVTTRSCMVLSGVPNLKKLGIKIELAPDAADPLYCFDHISHLTNLESLKCVIVNPAFKLGVVSPVLSFPCFSFSLKKLSLSGMGYPWKEMRNIASLPNLEVLKLRFNAFLGSEWELEENGFPNLEVLLIEDIDLVKLKWAHGSFKTLFVLRIKHCYKLEELHLENLPNIIEVEVVNFSPLTEWYVKNALKYSEVEHLCDVYLLEPSPKILESAEKELKSFKKIVERLDSRSRERMSVSLRQIVEAINKFDVDFMNSIMDTLSDEEYEDAISGGIYSIVKELKEVEIEYYTLPEDEEEVVSSRIVSKSKMVGLCDQWIETTQK